MQTTCNASTSVWTHIRKLIPTFVLIILAALAGGTDVFTHQVHVFVSKTLHDRLIALEPYALNIIFAALAVNVFYLFYHPVSCRMERVVRKTSATDDVKNFLIKALRLAYWLAVAFFVISCFAQDLMAKLALSTGLITAAVAFALQGLLNDFVSGILLQFTSRVKEGDTLKVVGVDGADGVVTDIGYIQTVISTDQGEMTVPNRTIWGNCTMRRKPKAEPVKQSLLILPDGVSRDGR